MPTNTTETGLESLIVTHRTSTGWAAGNPPNPDGLKTDYLWKRFLAHTGLTSILENYAQIAESVSVAKTTVYRWVGPVKKRAKPPAQVQT